MAQAATVSRPLKVHGARFVGRHGGIKLATADDAKVTCLVCMYMARRYIPIGERLRKHQRWQRWLALRLRPLR